MGCSISVIIPVYNVAPYLERCVKSVINQSYTDLEIILIDDGSTDRSGTICDELKRIDQRIIVIHQENQGLSVARNIGLDRATGDWIAFLDSDDWLEKEAYEVLLSIADDYKADISSCLSRTVCDGEEPKDANDSGNIYEYDNITSIVAELRKKEKLRIEVWNKLWKRALIGDIRFAPGQVSEDVHFDRLVFLKAERIIHVDKTLHNYLVGRPGSTNSSFKVARFFVFDEYDLFIRELESKKCNDAAMIVRNMACRYLLNMYIEAVDKKQTVETQDRIINLFKQYHKHLSHTTYTENAFRIFSVSPKTYYIISKMKTKMIK